MKNIFYIPALLMLMLSCRTVRHTERTVSVQKDSVAIQDSATNEHTIVTNVYHEKRDTTIRVEQRQADTTFNAADLTPLYNSAGAPVDRQHRFDGKGVHGNVTIRADGTVEVRCVCDSLQMIVTGLERIITEKPTASPGSGCKRLSPPVTTLTRTTAIHSSGKPAACGLSAFCWPLSC